MHLHRQTIRNQSGFSVVEFLLVVLVVAALAATGFVVYRRYKPSSAKNSAVTSTIQTTTQPMSTGTTQPAPDPYAGWQTFSDSQVSFRYPSDWTVENNGDPSDVGYLLNADVHKKNSPSLILAITVRSKDAKDAKISIGGAPSYTLPAGESVLETVTVDNSSYSLVGSRNVESTTESIYEVNLRKCASSTICAAYIEKGEGSITILIITKQGYGAPIDLQTEEYTQIKSIISSLKL